MEQETLVRVQKLETTLEDLKKTVRPGETPAYGISLFVALVLFVLMMSKLPLSGDPGFWPRTGIGVACAFLGGIIFSGALSFMEFAFKAIVEATAALLLLFDVTFCAVVWMSSAHLTRWLTTNELAKEDQALAVLVIGGAAILFLLNLLAFLVIYPAAKIAGTRLN